MSFQHIMQKLTLFWQQKLTIQELFDNVSQIYFTLPKKDKQDLLNWLNSIELTHEKVMISVLLLCMIPYFQTVIPMEAIKNPELYSILIENTAWQNKPINWLFTSAEVACFQKGKMIAIFSFVDHTTTVTIPKKLQHVWTCCNCNDEIILNNPHVLNAFDFYILLPRDEK